MSKVYVMDHPLIQHKVGIIRREEVGSKDFRQMISEIAMLMCYESTRNLKLQDVKIKTPICETVVKELAGKTRRRTDFACRTWYGRRYACNDSGCKSRTYRSVS